MLSCLQVAGSGSTNVLSAGKTWMTEVTDVRVCPETLAGGRVEMQPDGDGGFYCKGCGAPYDVVKHSGELVMEDWTNGGPGYRAPRPGEKKRHWE